MSWIGKGVLGVAGLYIIGSLAGSPDGAVKTTVADKPTNPIRMTARQIDAAVNNNEIAIQKRVTDAGGIVVTGKVDSVEMVWGSPVIHLKGENPFLNISAFLSKADTDFASKLSKGDSVSVNCKTVKKIMGAALYDCVSG